MHTKARKQELEAMVPCIPKPVRTSTDSMHMVPCILEPIHKEHVNIDYGYADNGDWDTSVQPGYEADGVAFP